MFIIIELISGLIIYIVFTGNVAKKPSSGPAYLIFIAIALLISGLLLGNIWALLVVFPLVAGIGVLFGFVLGVSVNWLSSLTPQTDRQLAIWLCGLMLLILMSFHSKYRTAYETLTACGDDVLMPKTALAVFEGLEDITFEIVLDPTFAWVAVSREDGGFFLGDSIYKKNLDGPDLRLAVCGLTKNFSRPIQLTDYSHTIRVSYDNDKLLKAGEDRDFNAFNYMNMKFQARWAGQPADQTLVIPNGQTLRFKFSPLFTRGWQISTDYHGLTMTFKLRGDANKPPIEDAIKFIETFDNLGYLTPSELRSNS